MLTEAEEPKYPDAKSILEVIKAHPDALFGAKRKDSHSDSDSGSDLIETEDESDLADSDRYQGKKRLTPQEEQELALRIQRGDRSAETELIEANYGFVVHIAKKYLGRGLSLPDLIQEGNIGLIKAAEKMKPGKGSKFVTYAVFAIKDEIRAALVKKAKTIRLPTRLIDKIYRYERWFKEAEIDLANPRTTPESIVEDLEALGKPCSLREVKMVLEKRKLLHVASLDAPLGEEGDTNLYGLVATGESEDGRSIFLSYFDSMEELTEVLQELGERERTVIELRFGLHGKTEHTLDEIGKMFNVTGETIRQIEAIGLRKLREIILAREKVVSVPPSAAVAKAEQPLPASSRQEDIAISEIDKEIQHTEEVLDQIAENAGIEPHKVKAAWPTLWPLQRLIIYYSYYSRVQSLDALAATLKDLGIVVRKTGQPHKIWSIWGAREKALRILRAGMTGEENLRAYAGARDLTKEQFAKIIETSISETARLLYQIRFGIGFLSPELRDEQKVFILSKNPKAFEQCSFISIEKYAIVQLRQAVKRYREMEKNKSKIPSAQELRALAIVPIEDLHPVQAEVISTVDDLQRLAAHLRLPLTRVLAVWPYLYPQERAALQLYHGITRPKIRRLAMVGKILNEENYIRLSGKGGLGLSPFSLGFHSS